MNQTQVNIKSKQFLYLFKNIFLGKEISMIESTIMTLKNKSLQETTNDTKTNEKGDTPITNKTKQETDQKSEAENNPWKLELFETKTEEKGDSKPKVDETTEQIQPTSVQKIKKLQRSLSQPAPFSQLNKLNASRVGSLKPQISSCYNGDDSVASDIYLYTLPWACCAMLFWKNITLLPLLPLPIIIYMLKHVGFYLGIWQWLGGHFVKLMEIIKNWCDERFDALVPIPIRGLYRIVLKSNAVIKDNVKDSIDTVSSIVVILGLIIFVTCASVFFAIQVCL